MPSGGVQPINAVDKLNILGLAAIVAATFATVATSVLSGRLSPATLARLDYIACLVLVLLFAGVNAVLLAAAALAS